MKTILRAFMSGVLAAEAAIIGLRFHDWSVVLGLGLGSLALIGAAYAVELEGR